jgi:hypothetical protein
VFQSIARSSISLRFAEADFFARTIGLDTLHDFANLLGLIIGAMNSHRSGGEKEFTHEKDSWPGVRGGALRRLPEPRSDE